MQFTGHGSTASGKGKACQGHVKVSYGYNLVRGKTNHPMEDYHFVDLVDVKGNELGLFAIFDGHLGDTVPAYLQRNLFPNILKEVSFLLFFQWGLICQPCGDLILTRIF
jgi:protein phosphatase 1L